MMYFFFFDEFKVGQRCEILEGHDTKFGHKKPGDKVIVTIVTDSCVFAYDDEPIKYRINKKGDRVVALDPKCIQSVYVKTELKILE